MTSNELCPKCSKEGNPLSGEQHRRIRDGIEALNRGRASRNLALPTAPGLPGVPALPPEAELWICTALHCGSVWQHGKPQLGTFLDGEWGPMVPQP